MLRSVIRPLPALAAALALTGLAVAALAPAQYEEARRTAPNHLHIAIEQVTGPGGGTGNCAVEGTVVKSFRGKLTPGTKLAFDVACYAYGSIPNGPTLWTDYDALRKAHFLEAFMTDGPEPAVAMDQVEIILSPRDVPYCDSNSLYCESVITSAALDDDCGTSGHVWNWLGLGAEECY